MSKKVIKIIIVLYFILMGIMAIFVLQLVDYPEVISEIPIIRNIAGPRIPNKKDLEKLEKAFSDVTSYLEENEVAKDEIAKIYTEVEQSPVCSIANRNFNSLAEQYEEYMTRIAEIQKCIEKAEKKYQQYITLLENIPKFSVELREEKYGEFEEIIEPLYASICDEKDRYGAEQEAVEEMYQAAKKIADDFFEEYYYWMSHIVNAEAGGYMCTTMERCCVANVIENRIMDPAFANTIYAVIFSPGQYEPAMSGSIYAEPYSWVWSEMEDYLRGRVETGMPREVVYQALFPQGSGTWKTFSSGHFFCYK